MLLVSNHTAFWDPLVAVWLTNCVLPIDSYAMMDAKNLRRLPFFRLVGAFGIDLDDPRDGGLAIRYAAKLLREGNRLVWVFAQGDERPITERPLGFRAGAAAVARLSPGATILPLALRYEFGQTERPGLHVNIGEPLSHERDIDRAVAAQEAAVLALMEELDALIIAKTPPRDDELLHQHSPGFWSRWAEAWLARLTRGETPTERSALPPGPRARDED